MPPKRTSTAVQEEQGLLSPIISQSFDLDELLRILCYLLTQCFREDQEIDEMVDAIRRMLHNVMEVTKTKTTPVQKEAEEAPRRKLLTQHHREVREFIEKMWQSYFALGDFLAEREVPTDPSRLSPEVHDTKRRKKLLPTLCEFFRAYASGVQERKCGSVR